MSLEFLFEVGCEEIPARLIPSLLEQLGAKISGVLHESTVSHLPPQLYGTPRRLVIVIEQVTEKQPDRSESVTGPPFSAAYDSARAADKSSPGVRQQISDRFGPSPGCRHRKRKILGL